MEQPDAAESAVRGGRPFEAAGDDSWKDDLFRLREVARQISIVTEASSSAEPYFRPPAEETPEVPIRAALRMVLLLVPGLLLPRGACWDAGKFRLAHGHPGFKIAGNLCGVGTTDLAAYLIATPQGNLLIRRYNRPQHA